MRARVSKTVLTRNRGYVCPSCRLQPVEFQRGGPRRSQHTDISGNHADKSNHSTDPGALEQKDMTTLGSTSRIRDMIKGLISDVTPQDSKNKKHDQQTPTVSEAEPEQQGSPRKAESIQDDMEAKQKVLQQKFSAQRRKQKLKFQASGAPKAVSERREEVTPESASAIETAEPRPENLTSPTKPASGGTRRARRRLDKIAVRAEPRIAGRVQQELGKLKKPLASGSELMHSTKEEILKALSASQAVVADQSVTKDGPKREQSLSKPATSEEKAKVGKDTLKRKTESRLARRKSSEKKLISERERKKELAGKLSSLVKKQVSDIAPVSRRVVDNQISRRVVDNKNDGLSKTRNSTGNIADVAGFESLQNILGKKAAKTKASIQKADARNLEILPLEVKQPPVPALAYGLERVLFNPGVYQLQDPRSRVYNFDPYLQKIMPVAEFDFNALKEYVTSSKDDSLKRLAREHQKRYVGSTSSMTSALAHFHFLLSQWRPVDTSMLSQGFPTHLSSFTELQRTPSAIFLRWRDGSYAIDADKQFANANILSMLGKSMEKLLTLTVDDYERYRKSSPGEVTEEEQFAPESYHYSTMGDFLMRSQLDAHDPRLPGTGMFDLKTRAVVSIRTDVTNYERGVGYQIKDRQGEWESYEREYYDMIRAAFLKYSMQVRMGRMDGIFVAFHNIERIFGFQYISLQEMDSTLHGQWDTSIGDQEFKLSLDLLNKVLDKATKKFPETSLRIHFETRDAATPFMYIFAEPVTEEQVAEIQGQNDAKIQEFERRILGMNREDDSESEAGQEDDGKWENIQASVQEAMDKDEMSVSHANEDQDPRVEETGDDALSAQDYNAFEEGPLYAKKTQGVAADDMNAVVAGNKDHEVVQGEDDIKHHLDGKVQKEYYPEAQDQETSEQDDHERQDLNEAPDKDSAMSNDPGNEEQIAGESDLDKENVQPKADDAITIDVTQQGPKETSAEDLGKEAVGRHGYTPRIPGEEASETEYQTDADLTFLDSMGQRSAQSGISKPSEILGMTLTLRNKVNNQYVLRPEKMTAADSWSVEYSLLDIPTPEKAKALYEACQMRRKKKLDAPVAEDEDAVSFYIAKLRELSASGKKWRERMDEKDRDRTVHILGQDIARSGGEGGTRDQEQDV